MEGHPKPKLEVPNRVAKLKQLSVKYRQLEKTEEVKLANLKLDQPVKVKVVTNSKKGLNYRPRPSH